MHLDSRELSELADDLWCGLNERHSGAKSHHVAAAVRKRDVEVYGPLTCTWSGNEWAQQQQQQPPLGNPSFLLYLEDVATSTVPG